MIKSFSNNKLRLFYENDLVLDLDSTGHSRLNDMLAVLNAVSKLDEMNVPGFDFKPYFNKKQTPGYWSTRVNDYWLLTFRFEHDHAFDVNLQPVFQVINNRSH